MTNYLGEYAVPLEQTPYANFTPTDWALHYIACYGGIDGEHHKAWVLDQVSRILHGAPVVVVQARWANGQTEWRFTLGEPTQTYLTWVDEIRSDGEYSYDEGIAP